MNQLRDSPWQSHLPLPMVQIYLRGHNAKTALERSLTAYYLWEASLKLLAVTAIVEYAERDDHDAGIEERLRNLAHPSTGHWLEFVRLLVPQLAEHGDEGFAQVQDLLFGGRRSDMPRAAELDAYLRELLEGKSGGRATVKLSLLFDHLVTLRNRLIGHGAAGQQGPEQYEKLGRVLLSGVGEILKRLDVLAGRRLIYVGDVQLLTSGGLRVERFLLHGGSALRDTFDLPNHGARILPERVYVQTADSELRPIHPLLIYETKTSEVFFLNGRRGKKMADYLSYTSGDIVPRDGLKQSQREFLSRILGVAVDEDQLEAWSETTDTEQVEMTESNEDYKQLGEFELISRIGRGGMGEVFRAIQPSLGREVALKCLTRTGDPNAESRFEREINALGRVEHPHLVKIFTAGTEEGQRFYAMELVEGTDLERVALRLSRGAGGSGKTTWEDALKLAIADTRTSEVVTSTLNDSVKQAGSAVPLKTNVADLVELASDVVDDKYVNEVVELIRQTASATHALHEAGLFHRDIKPANIMVDRRGKAVLMDLGLAKSVDAGDDGPTQTRQFVGTVCYASPEQIWNAKAVGRPSDVYSLGATLWHLLTLRPPFDADMNRSGPELMLDIQQRDVDPIRKYNKHVSRDLEAIVLKCMEKRLAARYQTALELAEDLARYQSSAAVTARHVGAIGRFIRRCRRRPAATATACAIAIMATVLVVMGMVIFWGRPSPETQLTPWQVAIETYPGAVGKWWFEEDDQFAWQMLPDARSKLGQEPMSDYYALYRAESADSFLDEIFQKPEFAAVVTPPQLPPPLRTVLRPSASGENTDLLENHPKQAEANRLRSRITAIQSYYERELQPTVDDQASPVLLHTRALVRHKLGKLQKQAKDDKNAELSYVAAKSDYELALAEGTGYNSAAPLRALCAFDEIRLLIDFPEYANQDQEVAVKKLKELNDGLTDDAKKQSANHWKAGDAFKMFRIVAFCEEGSECRRLAKTEGAGDSLKYFQQSEERYAAARDLAKELAKRDFSDEAIRDLEVETHVRLGLVHMDQWKFGDARTEFEAALATLAGEKLPQDPDTLTRCADSQERFAERMEYIKLRHRLAMVQCYTDSMRTAGNTFGDIINEMTQFLELPNIDKEMRDIVRDQRANSLERCSECVKTLAEKLAKLTDATTYYEADRLAPSASVAHKRIVVLALDPHRLEEASQELDKFEKAIPALTLTPATASSTLLERVVQIVRQLSKGDQEAATSQLRKELQDSGVTDRESIVTRLLTWQLLKTYTEQDDDSQFEEIFKIVREKTNNKYDLVYLDTYRDQVK